MFINDQFKAVNIVCSAEYEFYSAFYDWRKEWPVKIRIMNYDLFSVYCGC